MRIPFKKVIDVEAGDTDSSTAGSDPVAAAFSLDKILQAQPASSEAGSAGCGLSREARSSALQLIGTVREILVGDQVRSLDERFFAVQAALENNYSQLVGELSRRIAEAEASAGMNHAELCDRLSAQGDHIRNQEERVCSEIELAHAKTSALEEGVAASLGRLEASDSQIAGELANGLSRLEASDSQIAGELADGLSRLEASDSQIAGELANGLSRLEASDSQIAGELANGLSRLEASDSQIAGELANGLSRLAELEARVDKKMEELIQQQAIADQNINRNIARVAGLEDELAGVLGGLHQRDEKLEEQVQAQAARVVSLGEGLAGRMDEFKREEVRCHQDVLEVQGRAGAIEEAVETMGVDLHNKLRQVAELLTGQVAEVNRNLVQQREEIAAQMVTKGELEKLRGNGSGHSSVPAAPAPPAKGKAAPPVNGGNGVNGSKGANGAGKSQSEGAPPSAKPGKLTPFDFAPFPRFDTGDSEKP